MEVNHNYVRRFAADFYKYLDALIHPEGCREGVLAEAMRYCLLSGGKGLRPLLFLISVSTLRGFKDVNVKELNESEAKIAAAIEMLHAYSLVHDDLPALDNDDFRRGILSCHKKYGEAIAILTGNALMSYAFELINSVSLTTQVKSLISLQIAKAIGYKGVMAGQVLDLISKTESLTSQEYTRMQSLKTGKLFAVSAGVAGIIVDAKEDVINNLYNYGMCLGFAFQIADDIEDSCVEGAQKVQMSNIMHHHIEKSFYYLDAIDLDCTLLRSFAKFICS